MTHEEASSEASRKATMSEPEADDWIDDAAEDIAITVDQYAMWRDIAATIRKFRARGSRSPEAETEPPPIKGSGGLAPSPHDNPCSVCGQPVIWHAPGDVCHPPAVPAPPSRPAEPRAWPRVPGPTQARVSPDAEASPSAQEPATPTWETYKKPITEAIRSLLPERPKEWWLDRAKAEEGYVIAAGHPGQTCGKCGRVFYPPLHAADCPHQLTDEGVNHAMGVPPSAQSTEPPQEKP